MEKKEILDTNILIEGSKGLTTIFNIIEHPPASRNCDVLFPSRLDYKKAIEIAWKLRKAGTPIGAVDILISGMCINRTMKIVTNDSDFDLVKKVDSSLMVEKR